MVATAMDNLRLFLKKRKTVGSANLVTVGGRDGGKWLIPEADAEEFWLLYAKADIEEGFAYVPQPKQRKTIMVVDLDFRFTEKVEVERTRYITFIEGLLPGLTKGEHWVVLCESEEPAYLKEKIKSL